MEQFYCVIDSNKNLYIISQAKLPSIPVCVTFSGSTKNAIYIVYDNDNKQKAIENCPENIRSALLVNDTITIIVQQRNTIGDALKVTGGYKVPLIVLD